MWGMKENVEALFVFFTVATFHIPKQSGRFPDEDHSVVSGLYSDL